MNNFPDLSSIKSVHAALQAYRQSIGKETNRHHYKNEVCLMSFAMNGDSKVLFSVKHASHQEVNLYRRVVCMNRRLIHAQIAYGIRKLACRAFVERHLAKAQETK